jgi:uncharacterized protein (TIGR02145 family)
LPKKVSILIGVISSTNSNLKLQTMKHIFFVVFISTTLSAFAQVGIGTSTPGASAQLDVTSTSKGFLPPRMTYAQRNLISSPAAGLIIWCIDCDELQVYNGIIWKNISGAAASGPTQPNVAMCGQQWMIRNLNVTTYRNGDAIPQVTDAAVWASLTIGAWCWYNNDPANAVYGKLYNWFAVNDPRGLAPAGWHVASAAEWTSMSTCLGGDAIAGGKLKETGTSHWLTPNTGATNSSGFTALPGGARVETFLNLRMNGYWWVTNELSPTIASAKVLNYDGASVGSGSQGKTAGFSVRCVRD